ncbi:metallopeptidase family protein [Dermabacter sp. p3-SID358]|uniref:metallopeptidase family protein n=1 Tax=Dermabacter sp. p3-SID358 TaxID=2916114 RepID=UPI0021A63EE0|nr:metallopeptidase family protein [Dermabacter sp. p3-SID358]MCT1866725.1 metallopeptidase family protein [Dermabacter sp. p3-SID358]
MPFTRNPGPRRRDRHGRGFRGDLIPSHLPGFATPSDRFDTLVAEAMGPLYARFSRLEYLQVLIEEVPLDTVSLDSPPLGRYFPGDRRTRPRIILYRRAIESRARNREELAELVYVVVLENVAVALGKRVEDIDPWAA